MTEEHRPENDGKENFTITSTRCTNTMECYRRTEWRT